jgi:hypothetical protein
MRKSWFIVLLSMIQIIVFSLIVQAQVKVNPTLPEVIKIKTASGKLGRKNRESTEKLSFTEIDLSKYESGRIFADFKVSSGGCDAALVTTAIPTEDRKQLLELTRALSGGTRTADAFALSFGHVSLLGKKVNKFYVSGSLIPVGMAAWYSKDCVGSYEITVYIKNAKSSCQMRLLNRSTIKKDILIENPDVYISHIKIRRDGLEIKLTEKGLIKASGGGSLELSQKTISAGENKVSACLGIETFKLADEIKKHAVYYKIPIDQIRKRANPTNVTWEELGPIKALWEQIVR